MYTFFGINWAHTTGLFLFPFFALLFVARIVFHRKITSVIARLVHPRFAKKFFPRTGKIRRRVRTTLLLVALSFLYIAFLRPQWGTREQVVEQYGRDVLIVMDISRSMLASDMRPNRLEFAKFKIRTLLGKLNADRVGLVLFSGSAFVHCPLTVDYDAFLMFLDQVDVETIASGTTALDKALIEAIDVFKLSKGRKNKLVFLLTDGEDFSFSLSRVKQRARKENITLFAVGIGSLQGAPVPIVDGQGNVVGHEKDPQGKIILSRLNQDTLKDLTTSLGGVYVHATYQDTDIDTIVNELTRYEKEKFWDKSVTHQEEHYNWFAALSFGALLFEWLL